MKAEHKSLIFALLGRWVIQILFFLNKVSIKGEKNLMELVQHGNPVMVCVWHGRLLFPSWYIRLKTTNLHAIASHHSDAEIMARILQFWGYGLIRGSTKKDGKAVVQKMDAIFKSGGIVAVTNDGPKGPPRVAKAGSMSVALKNNVKIITITGSATKYWQMKSWDSFMLPKPFGKIQLIVSSPIKLSEKLINIETEVQFLSKFMNRYQDEADYLTGKIP